MSTKSDKPTVLIVGAGLGGLLLGALLEKSGVPYQIFERATTVKPLGMSTFQQNTTIYSICAIFLISCIFFDVFVTYHTN